MKKLWVSLLAMLLTFALLIGAWAEVAEEVNAHEEELYAEPVEEMIPEVQEFTLGEEDVSGEVPADAEKEEEAFDVEDVFETAVAAPELEPKSSAADFEIINGVLMAYHGKDEIVRIPDGVVAINDRVFSWYDAITEVIIPNGVKSIGDGSFAHCTNLKKVNIPNSVKTIGVSAFAMCESLIGLSIPNSVESIGQNALHGCNAIKSITLPSSLKKIEDQLFDSCIGLVEVTLPNSITSIGTSAFYGCSSLDVVIN